MGIRFSKSVKIGKFLRLNISKSGLGFSVGNKFFRLGVNPKGVIIKTLTLPKTGLSYVKQRKIRK